MCLAAERCDQSQHKIAEYAVSVFVRKPEKQQQYEHNTYQISIIGIFSVFPHYDSNTHIIPHHFQISRIQIIIIILIISGFFISFASIDQQA